MGEPAQSAANRKGAKVIGVLVFLWVFWFGWSHWSQNKSTPANDWQDKSIAPRVAKLRQKISVIESRPVNTVDDYIANTLELSPIVDEAKILTQKQLAMIIRFRGARRDNVVDLRAADYMSRLTEKDEQFLLSLGDEVSCAKELTSLPSGQRLAYYTAHVTSIKNREAELMKEWLEIAKQAKANGVPLPSYVDQSLARSDEAPQ